MCWCRIGRVGVSILTRGMDIALMIVLAYLPPKGGPVVLTILLGSHLVRKAVANCTRPLLRRCVFSCSINSAHAHRLQTIKVLFLLLKAERVQFRFENCKGLSGGGLQDITSAP